MTWRLETESVQLRSSEDGDRLPDVRLAAGDSVCIDRQACPPDMADAWFDAIMGLATPVAGRILMDGRSWNDGSAWEQDLRRASIRRVYRQDGWISNLDIVENITLSERHHTRRPTGEILEEASIWARRLGMPGLPAGRPAHAGRRVLRQAQWIRALLGVPRLMLIAADETAAETGVDPDGLREAVQEKQQLGAAAIWT